MNISALRIGSLFQMVQFLEEEKGFWNQFLISWDTVLYWFLVYLPLFYYQLVMIPLLLLDSTGH